MTGQCAFGPRERSKVYAIRSKPKLVPAESVPLVYALAQASARMCTSIYEVYLTTTLDVGLRAH